MLINFYLVSLFARDAVTRKCGIPDEEANILILILVQAYYKVYITLKKLQRAGS